MAIMRDCFCFLIIALPLSAASEGKATPRPLAPGNYCLKEELFGETGQGANIQLGSFLMEVTVRRRSSGYAVSFWNVMPDNQEILQGDTEDARILRDGSLAFEFTDGWENRGRARVRPNGRVELVMTYHAPMNQIGRNYGIYTLSRAACSAPEFQRPEFQGEQ
jgi:hypothetical protein